MTQLSLPDYGSTHPLVSRIVRLRGRVRLAVGLFGAGLLVLALAGGMFGLMLLDYLFRMPGWLRTICLIAWVCGVAYLGWKKLFLPLSTRLTDQFLASRVEKQNAHLSDDLISAVNFIHTRADTSNALAARHIDLAAQRTANIRFEDAVDFQQANRSLAIASVTLVIIAIVAFLNPLSTRIAFSRWFTTAPLDWPRSTHVEFDWSAYGGRPEVVPLGEKFTIRANVDKGGQPRVWIRVRTDRGTSEELMTYQKDQSTSSVKVYEYTAQPEGQQLTLRLRAGDDNDKDPVTIRLAPRPVMTEVSAVIRAPAYAQKATAAGEPAPGMVVNLLSQVGRATKGAQVSVRVKSTKAFKTTPAGEPEVALFDPNTTLQIPMAMTRKLVSPNEAEIQFQAETTLQGRLVMKDADGFENRSGGTLTLEVVPDAAPSIVITEPRRSVERAPDGFVEMLVQATDDWGFTGLKLRAEKFDAKPEDAPVFETDLPWSELLVDNAVGSTTGKSKYLWSLAPLKLEPGMRLSFYAMVHDNYDLNGQQHDWVKSAPLYLQIKSSADIQETQRKALSELADRLRNLKGMQEITRAQTAAIRSTVANTGTISDEQRAQLATLTQQQTQQAASANAIQQRATQIADELRQNNLRDSDLGKMSQNVSEGMQQVGQQNMPRAAADLSKAQERSTPADNANQNAQDAKQAGQSMNNANAQQDQAIGKMDDLLKELAATGDFDTLRSATAKILDEQKALNAALEKLAPKATGQTRDSLPPDVREQEDKIAAAQRELSAKTADILSRMEKAAQAASQSDPASAQSMQAASEAGKQSDVSGNQSNAAKSLAGEQGNSREPGNQINNARNQQTAATQGLQQMMDELNKNDLRKLEQLAREIRQLLQDVQKLRADEDALNKDTVAAKDAANAAIQKLADRQGRLQQNTIIVQKKAQSTQQAAQAAVFIGEASDAMQLAAEALYNNSQGKALKPETDAIAALDHAIDELKKAQNRVEPDAKNKQLAEYIKKYEEIQKAQADIKNKTDGMETRRQKNPDKELDRIDELSLAGVVKDQNGLIESVDALSKDEELKAIDVIVWMNAQVTESMLVGKNRVERQQLGKPLASVQQQSIDRLQLIIDALKEEQRKPPEFAGNPGGGGGGGGGGGQKPPLVPPMAQLKLLKSMQIVVNEGTKSTDNSIKGAANEAERNEFRNDAETLGGKQGEIRDRADRLMQQLLQQPGRGGPQGR